MKKIQHFSLMALLLIIVHGLHAVPAIPYPITFTQPNGEELTVFIKGDERLHWHETLDGYTLLYNHEKYLTYAQLDAEGNLQPSDVIATDIEKRDIVVHSFLYSIDKKLFYSDVQKQIILKVWEIEDEYEAKGEKAITGLYKTICAFVQFPEKSMIKTMSQFENLFNQIGYTGNGTGSVRDFFKESSYNQFDLQITLCGIYTATKSESYYAGPPGDGTENCQELARWTAQQVAAEPTINFADYDNNGDGKVDGFHFIFAGVGQEYGSCNTCIWSHKWQFSPPVTKNGKSISVYSCSPELLSGTTITTIGVICHEMTHAVLGAPDFYDTNYGTDGQYDGTGAWDIMAAGSWNGSPSGNRPAHHNMYTKVQAGWVTPTVLSTPTTVTNMPNAAENPVAYRINTGATNEHYLLENRQRIKFDTNIPGDGLIIYHVYNNVGTSCINCTHPQKMYPVCASSNTAIPGNGDALSQYGNINSAGCPFPGTSGKTAFNGTTTPRMFRWTNTVIDDKPITDITHNTSAKTISFNFMGGNQTFVPVTDITDVPSTATATLPFPLTGTVVPSNANNQAITWSVEDAGTTGATITENTFNTTNNGTATVLATITNGTSPTTPFTKSFSITVSKATLDGTVAINGNAVFGQTLTAVTTGLTSDPVITALGTLSYQWWRGTTNISGATSSTYTLVQADIGQTINVQVTAANCAGTVTSSNTAAVTKASQTAPAAPTLLSATSNSITLTTVTGCEYNINGGTYQDSPLFQDLTPSTSYPFTQRLKATATHFESPSSPVANLSTQAPEFVPVTDITDVPSTATATLPFPLTGTVVPSNANNQTITWNVTSAGTTGATITGNTFNTTNSGTATVLATITNGTSPTTPFTKSFSITVSKATLGGSVDITGNAVFGQTLTAVTTGLNSSPVIPDLGALSYQWRRGTANIPGATAFTYTLAQADIGQTINVQVTAANCTDTVTSNSMANVIKATPTAPAAPTLLSATSNSITLVTVTGCEYNINGGTYQDSPLFQDLTPSTSYPFTQRLKATATHFESPSSPVANLSTQAPEFIPVTDITDVPTTATATIPLTLIGTVVPSNANNKTITWSVTNAGTTGATITDGNVLNTTNSGTATVLATITNGTSPTTPFTKSFSITVSKATLGGTVAITGNAVFGQTLTAVTTGLNSSPVIPDLGALSYQWRRGTANIPGATSSTYTLIQADIGQTINVQVTAANCTDTVTSNSTANVIKATPTAPAAPTLLSATSNSITLTTVTGCEYNINGGTYQDSPSFQSLEPNTSYPFTQRLKETDTHLASAASLEATFATEPLGIEDNEFEKITVFSYQSSVYIKNESNISLKIVEIYDMIGQIVYKGAVTHPEMTISLKVASGIYTVTLISQDDKISITKVPIIK